MKYLLLFGPFLILKGASEQSLRNLGSCQLGAVEVNYETKRIEPIYQFSSNKVQTKEEIKCNINANWWVPKRIIDDGYMHMEKYVNYLRHYLLFCRTICWNCSIFTCCCTDNLIYKFDDFSVHGCSEGDINDSYLMTFDLLLNFALYLANCFLLFRRKQERTTDCLSSQLR